MKATLHMMTPSPIAYGVISGAKPPWLIVRVQRIESSRSANRRPSWPSAGKYSPPTVQRTTAVPRTAPTGIVASTDSGRSASAAPASMPHIATGTRKSAWSIQCADWIAQPTLRSMTNRRKRLSQPSRGRAKRCSLSGTDPLPPAEHLGQVVAAPHEAMPDVVLGEGVANRPELGPALIVVAADEAGPVEEDDEDADAASPQDGERAHPFPVRRAGHQAQGHAAAQLRHRGQ